MNTPPVGIGLTSNPNSPEYRELNSQEQLQVMTNQSQGTHSNRGAILAKDSLNVPLEFAFRIANENAQPDRPVLLPLFRARDIADKEQLEEPIRNYYEELRAGLSPPLREKLEQNERILLEDRDPNLTALDQGLLRFGSAALEQLIGVMGAPLALDDIRMVGAQSYLESPDRVGEEIVNYATAMNTYLDDYLAQIGPNDPSYDLLLNASTQIRQALNVLKMV